jgi:hypothetical protein
LVFEPKVTSIEISENADSYCFTEPRRGMGTFNDIVTYNCAEIVEYTSPEETAVCNLASLNMKKYVSVLGEINRDLLRKSVH